jgi:hypothetical protein
MKKVKAMGKRRMIFGSLSTSKKFNSPALSDKSRLLYLMMYPHSDDFGRMEAEPSAVKMIAVPGLDWSFKDIEACLSELSTGLLIEIYEIEGQKYLQIVAFDDHQTFARARVENYPPPIQQLNCSKTDLNSLKIREVKVSKEKVIEDKDKYLDFVFLTKDEFGKLVEKLGTFCETEAMIERLNNYIGSMGKHYKSHYHTILNWVSMDKKKAQSKPASTDHHFPTAEEVLRNRQ